MEPLRDWLVGRGWASESATVVAVRASLLVAYLIGCALRLLTRAPRAKLLKSEEWKEALRQEQRLPFKALAQSTQIAVWVYAAMALLSVLTGKDIWAVLTGLTAIGAVLVHVFRDPILGWTAAVQIAANDLLREKDWISVPKHGADGTVEEIALTSIKVRNWDKSVTAVPTYTVFSEGFRNWRGMFESGVRKIRRAIAIDAGSVRFCDQQLLRRLHSSPLVRELDLLPDSGGAGEDPLSDIRPTNLGCFRA